MPVRIGDNAASALPAQYSKPGQLRQEYQVDAALAIASVPADEIRRRKAPQVIHMNPDRTGFRRTPLTIEDVLATSRWAPRRRSWLSGAPSMPDPTEAPNGGASLRNVTSQGFA